MRAIVVGAGFAGLAAAAELHRAGVEVEVFEARNRVGGRVHSFPFAGAVAERGAEFILPGNQAVLATAARLGLALVSKGTRYGDREPKGSEPVTRAEVADAIAQIASQAPPDCMVTLPEALDSYALAPGVAEAIRARIEVSCASVPERFWCYTQLGMDDEPLPFVAAFAGTPGALEALDVRSGPERWIAALERLRPDLHLDPSGAQISTWAEDPWARGAYSAASATAPIDTEALVDVVGPLAFAGEHTAGDWHGLMEGALRSGARAAHQVLQSAGR